MGGKKTCFGFDSTADDQFRQVDQQLTLDVHEACSAKCANCRGRKPDDVEPIFVGPWEFRWHCRQSNEFSNGCGYGCRITIEEVVRRHV